MSQAGKPKATSFAYGLKHQLRQAEKYRNRNNNHWRHRIGLAHDLVDRFSLPRLEGRSREETVVVDVGCSIGTFAIEFARAGYRSFGIDFDPAALEIAEQLSREENVSPHFVCGDVSNWTHDFPPIDIAVCFDIFEHLHDDELGSLLVSIRKQLSSAGSLVFHTFPTRYDHIFFDKGYLGIPLMPLGYLPTEAFSRITRAYSSLIDVTLALARGATHEETLRFAPHCNLTTPQRLTDTLKRAGYEVLFLDSKNLYELKAWIQRRFAKQPITYRNIYGVAVPAR
jgi:2-polyprenyl-3-methyl-5-hydroxy-6-metoxy-1,4-benzoquinol methylase